MIISCLGLLNKMVKDDVTFYLVAWENYDEPTWEPSSNIPSFIINYYEKTGKKTLPPARVSHSKVVGGSKFHLLVWDSPDGEVYWEEENAFQLGDEREEFTCNTRKV